MKKVYLHERKGDDKNCGLKKNKPALTWARANKIERTAGTQEFSIRGTQAYLIASKPKLALPPNQLRPILLGGQATAYHRKLFLSEGHSDTPTLTRYLDETRFHAPAISRARALRSLM